MPTFSFFARSANSVLIFSLCQFLSLSASAQLAATFNRTAVETKLFDDGTTNLNSLRNSPQYPVWSQIIELEANRASVIKTKQMNAAQVEKILCTPIPSAQRAGIQFAACGDEGLVKEQLNMFDSVEESALRMAFQVWQDLPDRGLFVRYLLSDIIRFAFERGSINQVDVKSGKLVFADALLDSYFSLRLLGPNRSVGYKTKAVPNGVSIAPNGRAEVTRNFADLVQYSIRGPDNSVIVDRSEFALRIGSYTFTAQLLFLNYSAEYGFASRPRFFADRLLQTIFNNFAVNRWLVWAELFAFPELDSPRNVEYWLEIMPLISKNSEAVSRYLDLDKRPSASPISLSSAEFEVSKFNSRASPVISFIGSLGAIKSDMRPDEFVGFTGIELKAGLQELLSSCAGGISEITCSRAEIGFSIDMKSQGIRMLSVELVIDRDGQEEVYTRDLPVQLGVNNFAKIDVTSFEQTVRGVRTGKILDASLKIAAYRFFVKRSVNQPTSSLQIPVEFKFDIGSLQRTLTR